MEMILQIQGSLTRKHDLIYEEELNTLPQRSSIQHLLYLHSPHPWENKRIQFFPSKLMCLSFPFSTRPPIIMSQWGIEYMQVSDFRKTERIYTKTEKCLAPQDFLF